jgi:hypothetical protein
MKKVIHRGSAWKADPDGDTHRWIGLIEVQHQYAGVRLIVKAYPRESDLRFRVVLTAATCIWRLDYEDDPHINPLNAPEFGGMTLAGPHYHSWADNRRFGTPNSLPKKLRIARLLPAEIKTFSAAFRWFVDQTNIEIDSSEVPDLPRKVTLL